MVRGLRKIDVMLLRMIQKSKSQFWAVIMILMVGIAIFTALTMTSINMRHTVDAYYEKNNFADLFVSLEGAPKEKEGTLEGIPGIRKATGRIVTDVPMITDNPKERVNVRMVSFSEEADALCRTTLMEGRNQKLSNREILLVEQFAAGRNLKPGEEITLQIDGKRYDMSIAGIVASPEYIYLIENAQSMMPDSEGFGVCYVTEAFAGQVTGFSSSCNEFLLSFDPEEDGDQLIDDVRDSLLHYGVKTTTKREDQLSNSMIQQELKQLDSMAAILPGLFLLVAALILVMMLGRMVKRDRMKIGILKGMGYSNAQVLLHYVKYAVVAGVLGGAVGGVVGMGLSGALTKSYLQFFSIPLLRIDFYYSYILLAMVFSVLACAAAGSFGARGVAKIAPADSMRAELPKAGKRIFLEKIPLLWRSLTFSQKMVGKNIFRNKKRTAFVLMGVILTYGMMIFTTSMPDVMDDIMNRHFEEFQKMDYNVSFSAPVDKHVLSDFSALVDADYMEGKIEYPFELANGNQKQAVNIIGVSSDTRFYTFVDGEGAPVSVPKRGILLTENLAEFLDLEKGDLVQIKSYLPNRKDQYVRVMGVIKQSLGMNAYMEIDWMGKKLMDENIITGVYLNTRDENIQEDLTKASLVATTLSVEDIRGVYDEYMALTNVYVGFMVIFSGILGFCIVYNATVVSIGEREMELSSLRVLGFGKNEIFYMILRENIIITLVGIVLGIPVGKLFTEYSTQAFTTKMYSLEIDPTLSAAVSAGFFTVVFVVLAQMATYRRIRGLDFLKALKSRET